MVSFVQQTEGVRPTGIGNQQIVQRDQSYLDGVQRTFGHVEKTVDRLGDSYAQSTGSEIVRRAEQQVHNEVLESQELKALEELGDKASVEQTERRIDLIKRGVTSGKIDKDNARLRVAQLATKEIQSNPWFQDRIRQSAATMLGFDPIAEGTRQFFSAFEGGNTPTRLTAFEKQVQNLQQAGLSSKTAQDTTARLFKLRADQEIADLEYEAGVRDTDSYIGTTLLNDIPSSTQDFFARLVEIKNNNQPVDADAIGREIDAIEQAYINKTLTKVRSTEGLVAGTDTAKNIADQYRQHFDGLREIASNRDFSNIQAQELDRWNTAVKVWGAQAIPQLLAFNNLLGDRFTTKFMDILGQAGSPQELNNLLSAYPSLGIMVKGLNNKEVDLPRIFTDTVTKLSNGVVTNPDGSSNLTSEEEVTLGVLENEMGGEKATPEDREDITDLFIDNNLDSRATKIILGARESLATPKQKAFVTNRWNSIRKAGVSEIADAIVADSSGIGYRVEAGDTGLKLIGTSQTPVKSIWTREIDNDSTMSLGIRDLNRFLQSSSKGWSDTFGLRDPAREAQLIADEINDKVKQGFETQRLQRIEREEEAAKARAQEVESSQDKPTKLASPTQDLETFVQESLQKLSDVEKRARYEQLKAKAEGK